MNAWDISFSSLSVGYGDHAVLHDINATLPGGKVSVILGGSGCGKSTLLRHIIGLSRPISGNLRIGGRTCSACPMPRPGASAAAWACFSRTAPCWAP